MGFSVAVLGQGVGFGIKAGASPPALTFDFTTGSLPAGITFTRASIGTYNNSSNILTTASANVARFNYVGGVSCLLIEPAATNMLVQSNNFGSASWDAQGGIVVTAAQFISPDGTNNGWSLTTGAGNAYVAQYLTYSNIPYTMSAWGKQISGGLSYQLGMADVNGVVVITAALARISLTGTTQAGSGFVAFFKVVGAAGAGANGIYGAQLEIGSVSTSYIPTTTAAVTRAADSAVFTVPAGVGHLTYTFDDNSTQSVTVSAGSYTIPANLNRPNIKSIVGSA